MTRKPMLDPKQIIGAGAAALALAGAPALAEEGAKPAGVSIQLSALEEQGEACRMSLLIENGHAVDIDQAVYEIVLFTTKGQVAQLTLLDFQDLPSGRPRVRQFQFGGLTCDKIGKVLINGAQTCTGADLPEGACENGLSVGTLVDAELIG